MRTTLWIMCGAPGSGKSTYARSLTEHFVKCEYISRDEIRFAKVKNPDEYRSKEKEVLNEFYANVNAAIEKGGNVIADATHLTKKSRFKLINRILPKNKEDLDINIVYMDVDLDTCQSRNAEREGITVVPYAQVIRLFNTIEIPTLNENPLYQKIYFIDKEGKGILKERRE